MPDRNAAPSSAEVETEEEIVELTDEYEDESMAVSAGEIEDVEPVELEDEIEEFAASSASGAGIEQDLEIDLRSQQVTFPLRFETTLGVTGTTYAILTLLGALASGALGGGWFWQLLSWIKTPRKRAKEGEAGA